MFINPPRVRQPVAIILFFVNIFVPGEPSTKHKLESRDELSYSLELPSSVVAWHTDSFQLSKRGTSGANFAVFGTAVSQREAFSDA